MNWKAMKLASCLSLTLAVAANLGSEALAYRGNFAVSGWLVYWNPKSLKDFEAHAAWIDRVYPEWYIVGPDGMPLGQESNVDSPSESAPFIQKKQETLEIARAKHIQVFSMIVNFNRALGMHDGSRVEKMLQDPELRARHIAALVANAKRDGVDGIDIDYENLKGSDAVAFSRFMAELRRACASQGLLLAVAVAPKSTDAGTWDGNQAHDYRSLASSVDLIQPMTYDEHWATGAPGPISSPQFSDSVDRYAASVAGASKVELGLAGYGYDWKGHQGQTLSFDAYQSLLQQFQVRPERDQVSQEAMAHYVQGPDAHEVWFCDALSYRPKYSIIQRLHLAGLTLWYFGSEDPSFWSDVYRYKYASNKGS